MVYGVSQSIGLKYRPILVSVLVLDLSQISGFGRTPILPGSFNHFILQRAPPIYKPSTAPELCRPCDYMFYLKYHTDKPVGLILDLGGRHNLLTISLRAPLPIFKPSACTVDSSKYDRTILRRYNLWFFFCNRTMISAFLFDLAFLMKDATKKHICIL